eukprot:Gb_15031 [translate_table: standard]
MPTLHLVMEFIGRNWPPFWYSLTCAIFSILFLNVYGESRRKRRLPPGPLVGNLLALEHNVHECLLNLVKTYGPLMTFGFGMKITMVLSSSSMAKQILKDNDQTFSNKSIPSVPKSLHTMHLTYCGVHMAPGGIFSKRSMSKSSSILKSWKLYII